ncbi:lethal giant larvae like, C-terminal-domain-containing protein [Dipodascopsis tothii]|uniref:lethal giant larvae like, C-terminal-domain-containing protein n=1 Tax=Dipodascopsis tothii TaxID=44089 RepID=UPI0034CDE1CD
MINRLKTLSEFDLSASLSPEVLGLDDLGRFGIDGGVSVVAYCPIQSLLAVGTDSGRVYVFGQPGVEVRLDLAAGTPIDHLRIVRGQYLVTVDRANTLAVLSLSTKSVLSVFRPPQNQIVTVETDPGLDWAFLGLDNGATIVYDIDRGCKAPFRVPNLQKVAMPAGRLSAVVFIALHPRSLSLILFGYLDCAVVYSVPDGRVVHKLIYELPPGAPGGELDPARMRVPRRPVLTTGAWHPHGHHIITAYDDGSFVFWDATQGVLLHARTLENTDVNVARPPAAAPGVMPGARREPIFRLAWTCTANPEDTALVVAGGDAADVPVRGITYLEFGPTPLYQVTSFQAMGEHYAYARRQRIYPVPPAADPVDLLLVPRATPFYGGGADPFALIAVLSSGELYSLEYPSGAALPVAATFPPSLCWIQPRLTALAVTTMRREHWVGMMASAHAVAAVNMLQGGAPVRRKLRFYDTRSIVVTGHLDGCVRLWDASHGELENSHVLQVDVGDALRRADDLSVTSVSFAGATGEIAVALVSGEVVLYRFGVPAKMPVLRGNSGPIRMLAAPGGDATREAFVPLFALDAQRGPVTALKNSEIGFLAVGYQFGALAVVDLRTSTMIYLEDLANVAPDETTRRFARDRKSPDRQLELPTALEFAVMMLDTDPFSSIVLTVGTSLGRVLTYRVVPAGPSKHVVEFVAATAVKGSVLALLPYDADTGVSAVATASVLPGLAQGVQITGAVVAVSADELRIVRLPRNKLSSRSLDDKCLVAGLCFLRKGDTLAVVTLTRSGFVRVYAVPSLREVKSISVQHLFDVRYAPRSSISLNGDLVIGVNKNEAALLNIWGKGQSFRDLPTAELYDALRKHPPRPTISTVQWISGTKYVTQDDFDLLVGGANRPKSQATIDLERAQREQRLLAARSKPITPTAPPPSPGPSRGPPKPSPRRQEGGWFGSNDSTERTERLNFMSDSMSRLEQTSNEYMSSLTKFMEDPRKNAAKSYFKSKFLG